MITSRLYQPALKDIINYSSLVGFNNTDRQTNATLLSYFSTFNIVKSFWYYKTISKAERGRLETLGANIIFKSVDNLPYK